MKKVLKHVLFCSLLLYSFSASAQTELQQYIDAENARIAQVQTTETAITNYINANFATYNLSQATIDEIMSWEIAESQADVDSALANAKRDGLRKQYFDQNPNAVLLYQSIYPSTDELRQACINGGFELGPLNYTFNSASLPAGQMSSCNTTRVTNAPVNVPTNNFNSRITMMSSTAPGYIQFDPTLNTAARGFIQIPTLSPNGGTRSMKLNVNSGGNDVSTMSRTFVVNNPLLEYEFSVMLQDAGPTHSVAQKPFFKVELIVGGVVQFTRCITAQPNCIFNVSHATNTGVDKDIYFSNWRCDQINVAPFIGQTATVAFTVGDCSQGGHYGTAYIDNICNYSCSNGAFGLVQINPLSTSCNSAINGSYQVCGSFTPPVNATLSNTNGLTISIAVNNGIPLQLTATPTITGNNYCFTIPPAAFGTFANGNTYTFQVTANFVQTCGTITANTSATASATVTFTDCVCPPTLTLSTANGDDIPVTALASERLREVQNWIRATNRLTWVTSSATGRIIYKAGNFVELNPGFEAASGVQFASYIQACPGTFTYRQNNKDSVKNINTTKQPGRLEYPGGIAIYPNPSNNIINIVTGKTQFNKISITSIDGRKIYERTFENRNILQLDISSYANGIYIINIRSDSGEIYSRKLIKN